MSYKEQAESLGIKIDGRWSEERIQSEIGRYSEPTEDVMAAVDEISDGPRIDSMNILARRIFDGQGSISNVERVRRITNALKNRGYTQEDIKSLDLPIENLSKYLG